MIDFPILDHNPTLAMWTICGLLYFFTLFLFYKNAIYDINYSYTTRGRKRFFVFLVFIYSLCAFYTGDWMHLQAMVKGTVGNEIITGFGLEQIYQLIINFVKGNYLYFRVIVWGLGLFCLFNTFNICGVDAHRALLFFFGIYITSFVYARVGVALSIYFLGMVLFYKGKEDKKILYTILGVLIIFASMFFHRSLLLLVILAPLTLFPINKKTFPILIVGILCIFILQDSLLEYALTDIMSNDEYTERIEMYGFSYRSKNVGFNMDGLFFLWRKAIVHVPFWICIVKLYKRINSEYVPHTVQALFRFSILLYTLVIVFLGTYGSGSPYYYRYEGMLYIPITIMSTYLFQNEGMTLKTYKTMFWLGALCMSKDFLMSVVSIIL